MKGTFGKRIDQLAERVGDGTLRGQVEVAQPHAVPVHEGHWLDYYNPGTGEHEGFKELEVHSGETHFLQRPLMEKHEEYLERLASAALESGGLHDAMAENVEDLSSEVERRAPRRDGILANSAHPTVEDQGEVVYDRPPIMPPMSSDELDRLERGRRRGASFGPSGRMTRRPKR